MCGIFAFICKKHDFNLLNTYYNKIKCRGPDNSSLTKISDSVFFGFHRLAINGTDFISNQPLFLDNITLICNGEIYNYKQLANDYGFKLNTNSDCEIILHLYKKLGIKNTLSLLDGVFSFVLFNYDTVIVARDPIGVRPTFICNAKNYTLISSEAKCNFEYTNNIYQLLPGHYQIYKSNKLVFYNSYYKLPTVRIYHDKINDVINNLQHLLIRAVQKRLMSDRPIGSLLSGGLDSSIISAILSKKIDKLNTFSIGLQNSPDLINAAKVAKYIESNHHEVVISIDDMINAIDNVIRITETFDITTIRASVPNYLISKYISENTDVKVLFSGEGADEIFGGYLYFKNAPNLSAFDNEITSLVKYLFRFDVLRCDRTTASNGLEVRVPFLDKDLIDFVLSLSSCYKLHNFDNANIEKFILRKAFESFLPDSVLWRQKDAFSDAVGYNWVSEIKKFTESQFSDAALELSKFQYINHTPTTKEGLYYRKIFEHYYPNQSQLIGKFWLPKWTDVSDPSATLLPNHIK